MNRNTFLFFFTNFDFLIRFSFITTIFISFALAICICYSMDRNGCTDWSLQTLARSEKYWFKILPNTRLLRPKYVHMQIDNDEFSICGTLISWSFPFFFAFRAFCISIASCPCFYLFYFSSSFFSDNHQFRSFKYSITTI